MTKHSGWAAGVFDGADDVVGLLAIAADIDDHGRAVLLVSLELEELRNVADRLLVIADGRIVGEFAPDASDEELGLAMTGGTAA